MKKKNLNSYVLNKKVISKIVYSLKGGIGDYDTDQRDDTPPDVHYESSL